MTENNINENYSIDNEEYNSFIRFLKEKETKEIEKIIERYISYKPEMAEAALYVAVERGLISYDLKEKITGQIRFNFSVKSRYVKQAKWEKNNAFFDYARRYSDDQIYEIIDNPSDMVIDFFHAVLLVARERELISEADFNDLFENALKTSRTETEILRDDFNDAFGLSQETEPELTDDQITAYQSKYWKCPNCNELVENNFDLCWKCQSGKPADVMRPDRQEIINELRKPVSGSMAGSGLALIGAGLVIFLASFFRHHTSSIPWNERYITLAFTGFFIIAGIVFIILGASGKNNDK